MKKQLAALLAVLVLLSAFSLPAAAAPLSAGTALLNAQFKDGAVDGGYDYVAFSPVKGETDTAKYPLLVWLHGRQSGAYPRAQLQRYEFSNWASDEYQARFSPEGGCFLFAPRESRSGKNDWESSMCATLKMTVDAYVAENAAHIDTDRIYIAGYSTGGSMVWDMITRYPDFFAAAMPLAAIFQPTAASQLARLKGMSLWLFTSDRDPYLINETADVRPTFDYIAGLAADKSRLRMTSFSEAFFADGTKKTEFLNGAETVSSDAEHYIWEAVTYDLFMADGVTPYVSAKTVDGAGRELRLTTPGEGVISWLSRQSRANGQTDAPLSFLQRVVLLFNRFFAMLREFFGGRLK